MFCCENSGHQFLQFLWTKSHPVQWHSDNVTICMCFTTCQTFGHSWTRNISLLRLESVWHLLFPSWFLLEAPILKELPAPGDTDITKPETRNVSGSASASVGVNVLNWCSWWLIWFCFMSLLRWSGVLRKSVKAEGRLNMKINEISFIFFPFCEATCGSFEVLSHKPCGGGRWAKQLSCSSTQLLTIGLERDL